MKSKDEFNIALQWMRTKYQLYWDYFEGGGIDNVSNTWYSNTCIFKYPEITFEQFEKYVLIEPKLKSNRSFPHKFDDMFIEDNF